MTETTMIPEILGATDAAVANLITKMQEMGFNQAPDMFEGVVRKITIDGIVNVSAGGFFFVLFLLFMWSLMKGIKIESDNQDGCPYIFVGIIAGVISISISLLITFSNSAIVKFLDPEAWFYAQLFNKLL